MFEKISNRVVKKLGKVLVSGAQAEEGKAPENGTKNAPKDEDDILPAILKLAGVGIGVLLLALGGRGKAATTIINQIYICK